MKNLIYLILFISVFAWAVPKEQDRQLLEGADRNLLPNPGFEARGSGWSKTGTSVFTTTSTLPAFGKRHGTWDPGATGEFLNSEQIAIPEGLKNRNCSIGGQYKWSAGVSGEIKLQVYDGSSVLFETPLDPSTDWQNLPPGMFTCPSSGTIGFRLESTADAAIISLDSLSLGKLKTINVSQAELVADAFYAQTSLCDWTQPAVGISDFPVDTDCPSITVLTSTQAVDTTDNNLPDIDFDNLTPGIYEVVARVSVSNSVSANSSALRISDGVTFGAVKGVTLFTVGAETAIYSVSATFTYTVSGPRNFKLQGTTNVGNLLLLNDNLQGRTTSFTVRRYPLTSSEAITLETVGEHWDVNIGGFNPSLGTASVTAYQEIANTALDMVVNPGSKSAQVPCSLTNPSTGLTCGAGAESIGIVINNSTAGRYRVCGAFGHFMNVQASSAMKVVFQWVETPNNAQTILQLGNERATGGPDTAAIGADIAPTYARKVCGNFTFASPGQKTLRLMHEQFASGTVSLNTLLLDRTAVVGDQDMHITVEKLDQQMPTPVFTDLTNSLNKTAHSIGPNGLIIGSSDVQTLCNSSPCTIGKEIGGDWLVNITRLAQGSYQANFQVGAFPVAPVCTCTSLDQQANDMCHITTSASTTTMNFFLRRSDTPFTGFDGRFVITCIGDKQ